MASLKNSPCAILMIIQIQAPKIAARDAAVLMREHLT
jgi:hypothetical protein